MKKIILCLLFLCLITVGLLGKTIDKLPLDSAVNNLIVQQLVFPQEKIYLQTDKPYYVSGEKIFFRSFLLDASLHQPAAMSRYIYVELINQDADRVLIRLQIRPKNNLFSGYIQIPEDLEQGTYLLRAYTRFMTNTSDDFFFTRPVFILHPHHDSEKQPNKSTQPASQKFDVSFYPEGGNLIAGKTSCVAFKALASNGENVAITGELYDSKNNLITEFSTYYNGMGRINFQPKFGERYSAVCYHEGKSIKVSLPEVKNNTLSLKTAWRKNELWINVNKPDNFNIPPLYLLIHTRGHLVYAGKWDEQKELLIVDKAEFPSGVSHILLLTEDYQPISERLIFAFNDDPMEAALVTDKKEYLKREKVQVNFALPDSISGNFAVSVTDDNDIQLDEKAPNILSSILLTSDLRGYIHNPAYYLKKNDKQAGLAADMLMMTQGWTRYDIPKTLRGDFQYPTILPERSQIISGMVNNGLLAKPYAGAKVTIVSSNASFFEMGETDETGHFSYPVEFPDSTVYWVKAMNRKDNKGMIELLVNKPDYPHINANLKTLTAQNNPDTIDIQSYVAKADTKYIQENGIRMIDLKEVVVKGKRPADKYKSSYSSIFAERVTEEQLEKMHVVNMPSLLNHLPGVWATGSSIKISGGAGPPLILIDGMVMNSGMEPEQTIEMLNTLNVSDIGQIEIVKGVNASIYGPEATNGVIEIFTKRGDFKPVIKPNINIKLFSPLGYQQPVEFYSPKYDTPEAKAEKTPDLRSVIYWKPDVLIDTEGKTAFEFYTSDSPSTYTVVIEGVTDDGKLIYHKADRFISVK